mmetsp:Transcript_1683/g.2513  ORF Transcript_1683/g.2513 Transcript_1683/m.2513 type:complete len:285 (+) Transcript_1683:117-971(+)
MKSTTKLLLLVCLLAFIICMVAAQDSEATTENIDNEGEELVFDDDDDEEVSYEEETVDDSTREDRNLGELFGSGDVEVSYVLPENANKKISVGKKSKILLGFTNNGLNPFTIYGIRGYISHPQDSQFVVQNFTAIRYNTTVQPEETNSLMYEFFPDPRLETVDFGMTMQVFYINEDNDTFVHHFFNETVTFVENSEVIDVQQYYLYATLLAIAAGVGYYVYNNVLESSSSSSSSSSSVNTSKSSKSSNSPSSPSSEKSGGDDEINFNLVSKRHLKMVQQQKKRR